MVVAAILDFWNLKFVTVGRLKRVELRRDAKFGRNPPNYDRDMANCRFFQDGSCPPCWIYCVWTNYERHLVVFIAVQNLAGINTVISIICMFFRFREFGLKTPIHAPKLWFLGILPLKWGAMSRNPKKAHPCASPRSLSYHARKSVDASDL